MAKVLIATEKPFAPAALNQILPVFKEAGYEVELLEKYTEASQLLEAVAGADGLIIRSDKVTREVLEAGKNLKIVVRAGAGYDNVDLEAATEKGVVVMNTPGQNANAVAELVMGMLLYLLRNNFNGTSGRELKGRTVGLHGYGHVAHHVASIAKCFDVKVFAFDPFMVDRMKEDGVYLTDDLEEFYAKCDVISLHMPSNAQTRGMVNYNLLSRMPKDGVVLNSARKDVINEADLLKVMEERPDLKFGSDIAPDAKATFEEQFAGRVFFTPKKMGAQTLEANINAGVAAAHQIVKYVENGDETFRVNR